MARSTSSALATAPRVNLLPPSEVDRREREKLSATWVRVVLLMILLAVLLVGAAFAWSQYSQQRLVAEQNRTTQLIGEISGLSEVSRTLATERELFAYRSEAMGADLAWSGILDRVRGALPGDVILTGFDLTPGAAPAPAEAGADAEALTDAAKQAVGLTGTITVESLTPREMAPFVRALRGVEGIADADANATNTGVASAGTYNYTIDITFDQTVYSNAFALKAEEQK